jgi:hypothetical protein
VDTPDPDADATEQDEAEKLVDVWSQRVSTRRLFFSLLKKHSIRARSA